MESETIQTNTRPRAAGNRAATQAAANRPTAASTPVISQRTLLSVMLSVLLGVLLGALDQTVVGPAMPKIIGELNGFNQYAWVFTAYMLTSTISVPIVGKLSDMYGRKWIYASGIGVFLIGSMLSGMSADINQLIIFRGLQGLGAGMIFASAFSIVADLIPPANRGKWQGAFGAVWGLSAVIGPSVGGWLTDGINWRWVFYVNVPVALVALAVVIALYPKEAAHAHDKVIDWLGTGALVAGLTPLLLALSLGGTPDWDWSSPRVIGFLVASALFLALFIVAEARAKEPILPLDLFKNRTFAASAATVFFTGVGLFGATLYIPLFIQAIQGDSATSSGNALTPMMISLVIASVVSGQVVSRTGKYRIMGVVGMVFVTVGMFLLYSMGMDTQRWVTILYMVLLGFGMGITFPLYTLIVQNDFPLRRVGVVTAALQFFRSIGGTVGVAVLGSLVNTRFHDSFPSELAKEVGKLPAAMANQIPVAQISAGLSNVNPQALTSPEGAARLHDSIVHMLPAQYSSFATQLENLIKGAMKPALFDGIQTAFLLGAILFVVGLITTSLIVEKPLRKTNESSRLAMAEGPMPSDDFGDESAEAGREMAAEGLPAGVIPADDEPDLVGRR